MILPRPPSIGMSGGPAKIAIAAAVAVIADLTTKYILHSNLHGDPRLIADTVGVRVIHNSGAAFGFAAGAPTWVILSLTSAAALALAVAAFSSIRGGGAIPAGLAIGGAAGNILDRAGDGSVVDWIDIGPWPIFNLADTFLVLGIFFMFVTASRSREAVRSDPEKGAGPD